MAIDVSDLVMGPNIGRTTPTGFRLWGRGPNKSAAGVARAFNAETIELVGEKIFPLVEYYDYVGIVDFGVLDDTNKDHDALAPKTRYKFQMGIVEGVSPDDLTDRLAGGQFLNWDAVSGGGSTLRTSPQTAADRTLETRFFLGSCRDPRGQTSEPTFGTILNQLTSSSEPHPDFILMTGDQIYIDRPPKGFPKYKRNAPTPLDQYWKTYQFAFGGQNPNFAAVMRRLPAYLMFDDHEIRNNWTGAKFTHEDKGYFPESFANGQRAFEAYQACLGGRIKSADTFGQNSFPGVGKGKEYWFDFSHGNCDFFMTDVRTGNERHEDTVVEPKVLNEKQFVDLSAWLKRDKGRVKFIVSAVPVFPDTRSYLPFSSTTDKWGSGVQQRYELLEYIRKERIPKVVFLSGDVHVSYVAELTHEKDRAFKTYQIVSSTFNWKPPGLQRIHFDFGLLKRKNVRGERPSKDYRSRRFRTQANAPDVHHSHNFARICATANHVQVEYFRGDDGTKLETVDIALSD